MRATVERTGEPISLINGIPSALIQKVPERPVVTPIRRVSHRPSTACEIFPGVGHRLLEIQTESEVKWEWSPVTHKAVPEVADESRSRDRAHSRLTRCPGAKEARDCSLRTGPARSTLMFVIPLTGPPKRDNPPLLWWASCRNRSDRVAEGGGDRYVGPFGLELVGKNRGGQAQDDILRHALRNHPWACAHYEG